MDGHGFDRLARALAAPGSRRRLLAAWCAATIAAVGTAVGVVKLPTDAQSCAAEDEPCQLWNPCCAGLVCVASPLNPNNGVCIPGVGQSVAQSDPGDGRNPRPTNTPNETTTPTGTNTPSETTPTATSTSNKRASLKIQLRCGGTNETLEIENIGDSAVTIERITALSPPKGTKKRDSEFKMDRLLSVGAKLTFTSGPDAPDTPAPLTKSELYPNDGDNANAVEITTSGGTSRAACSTRRSNGNDGGPQTSLKITAVCGGHQDAEKTTIKNTGSKTVVIKSIDGNPIDSTYSRIPSGETRYYFSGPQGTREPESAQTVTTETIYGTASDRKTAVVKTADGEKFDSTCTKYSND